MSGEEQRMSDYLDGWLAPGDKAAFEADLASDPNRARRLSLLRAMRAMLVASARPMPADLKAALKRLARARAPRSSWLDMLRQSLAERPWACGAGAAFAAAGLMIILRLAATQDSVLAPIARVEPRHIESVASAGAEPLAELWTDDDGGDQDEG
ncbi:MAG: hypothetical protein AAB262_05175 [Elusimicrobiota bacterium]